MNGTTVISKLSSIASGYSAVLKRMAEPLRLLLSFSLADDSIYPAKVVSASLEKGSLSVVYGTRLLSRLKIHGSREYSFEEGKYPQPEVFASSISLAMNDLGAAKTDLSLNIPKAWVIIKTAEFPVTVKENLANVISYELDRITPFTAEDAFYDFMILGEDEGKLSILVIAAKADPIKSYIDALKEKGIAVGRLTVNLSCFETLCRYIEGKKNKVFIDVGKEGYEGALFMNGSITNAFAGNFSGTDEKSNVGMLTAEILPLVDILKNHGGTPQIMVYFRDASPSLRELLKEQIAQPLRILNETDIRIAHSGLDKNVSYSSIGGVLESLWPNANKLNLLNKGRHARLKTPKGLTIILLLLILGMWLFYIVSPLRIEAKRLQEIDRQILMRKEEVKKVEALKKEVESLSGEISAINDFKGNRRMALNILKELTTILPKNTWLSRVRITETNVDLEGYATSATGLLPKLETSSYFKKAEFGSPTFRDTRMNADRFNIKMEIEGVVKDETKDKEETEEDEEE